MEIRKCDGPTDLHLTWVGARDTCVSKKEYFIQALLLIKFSDPHRLIREQQRQVSKVLLDGLYDPDSPISKLLGVHTEVMGEIIWQKMLSRNWHFFPGPDNPAWL